MKAQLLGGGSAPGLGPVPSVILCKLTVRDEGFTIKLCSKHLDGVEEEKKPERNCSCHGEQRPRSMLR